MLMEEKSNVLSHQWSDSELFSRE